MAYLKHDYIYLINKIVFSYKMCVHTLKHYLGDNILLFKHINLSLLCILIFYSILAYDVAN